jgi:hypothetical protein
MSWQFVKESASIDSGSEVSNSFVQVVVHATQGNVSQLDM